MSSPSVNEPEQFNFPIGIALIVAWTLIYLCMVQGITESGKVVYITAIFPYVVLIIFFFRGITLKGATDGIAHLFTPKWEILLDPVVWLEAGTQVFFSLGNILVCHKFPQCSLFISLTIMFSGLAFGGLIAFSKHSYCFLYKYQAINFLFNFIAFLRFL